MMRDLLTVDRTAIDEGLVGLSENGVERFVHTDVDDGGGDPEGDNFFEAFNHVGALGGLL
jgi:hypothetical protein